ncbi:MAG: hypothetical protein ACC628_04385 [Pirellulaceae bacterium]
MRRLSKSEVEQRKQRRQKQPAAKGPAPGKTPAKPDRPVVPFDQVVTLFKDSVVDYYAKVPHLRAFAQLRASDPASADLLNADAAALFEEVRQASPGDPIALHHLAIIHHGRGYQLHLADGKSTEAIRHWHNGVQAWAALVRNDAFWDRLSGRWRERWEASRNDMLVERLLRVDLKGFRRQIPGHLLGLHTAIVLESFQSEPAFAKEHMTIALKSDFETADIEAARQRVYTKLLGGIRRLCKAMKFAEARDLVNRYLTMDPDNPKALCDALVVCVAECKQEGVGDQKVAQRLRRFAQEQTRASSLIERAKQDWSVAEALRDFYLQWADAEHDNGQSYGDVDSPARWKAYREAMRHAKVAVGYERCGDAARRLLLQICWNASVACFNANADLDLVRDLVKDALLIDDADVGARAVNAYYYLRKQNDALFRQELKMAEDLNVVSGRPEVANLISQLKQAAEEDPKTRQVAKLFKQANDALAGGMHHAALEHLRELEPYESDLSKEDACTLHLLKTVCYMNQGSICEAQSSYRRAASLLPAGANPDLRNLITKLAPLAG